MISPDIPQSHKVAEPARLDALSLDMRAALQALIQGRCGHKTAALNIYAIFCCRCEKIHHRARETEVYTQKLHATECFIGNASPACTILCACGLTFNLI
jgi:hypothetical protein